MSGFVEGIDRSQSSLFPAELEDYVAEDNLVRAVDAFVEGLDLGKFGFGGWGPTFTLSACEFTLARRSRHRPGSAGALTPLIPAALWQVDIFGDLTADGRPSVGE
jgi:hypothetical protein